VSRKKFIALLASICLVVMLVLSACTQQGGTTPTGTTPTGTTTGAAQDKVYKVLNPTGIYIPVDCKALSARLDSLAGKKIRFYESEATNIQLPTLRARLEKDYPTTTFVVEHTESFGRSTPNDEDLSMQAAIRGVGW
jgi:ABC-type oligopeptide transport system substrate-binding subunit